MNTGTLWRVLSVFVQGELPAAQRDQDQGDGGGFQ